MSGELRHNVLGASCLGIARVASTASRGFDALGVHFICTARDPIRRRETGQGCRGPRRSGGRRTTARLGPFR